MVYIQRLKKILIIVWILIYIFSITEAEKVAFLLGVNAGDLLKSLLKPKIKVGTEVVTQGRTKAQVRYISMYM